MEKRRAGILEFNLDRSGEQIYALASSNLAGLAADPQTVDLWVSINERNGLGDDLVPDYVTRVMPRGFYGWP